jgi:hypothetical protein
MPSKRSPAPMRGDKIALGKMLGAKSTSGSLGRITKKSGGKRGKKG